MGTMILKKLALLLFILCLGACARPLPDGDAPDAATYRVATDIRFNLAKRDFLLHIPPGAAAEAPLPLVVVLHGAFSTAAQTETETGFSQLADKENFFVAYPEGIGIFGYLQHWNAGHCCGKAARDDIDDIAFVDAVINKTKALVAIDNSRIYMAGMSNGGMLTYRYAAERGSGLAAIAVVSGVIGSREKPDNPEWLLPPPSSPLPVIAFHGTGDKHIPIAGGASPRKGGGRSYSSFTEAQRFWQEANRCTDDVVTSTGLSGSLEKSIISDCADGSRIEYFRLKDWGHQWPAEYFTSDLPESDKLKGFNATEQIWNFFRQFKRTP